MTKNKVKFNSLSNVKMLFKLLIKEIATCVKLFKVNI